MAYQIETTCICGDPETSKNHSFGAVSVPIYQTATFAHPGIGESTGHNYTRESNPTRDELEKTVSALEGAEKDENDRYLRAQYYIETHFDSEN